MTKIPNLWHKPPTQSLKGGSEPTDPVSVLWQSAPGRIPAPATPWSGVPPASTPSIPLGGAAHGPWLIQEMPGAETLPSQDPSAVPLSSVLQSPLAPSPNHWWSTLLFQN